MKKQFNEAIEISKQISKDTQALIARIDEVLTGGAR